MEKEPTLLDPGPHSIRLIWSTIFAMIVLGVSSLFGLLQWCGDGVETCASPELARELAVRALTWAASGGIVAGSILALTPWSKRLWTRIWTGIAVAAATVLSTGIYLLL